MFLEQKAKHKRLFRKCITVFFVAMVVFSVFSITAFADEGPVGEAIVDGTVLNDVKDGEEPWGWPLSGLYESIRLLLFSMVQMFMSCAFGLIDNGTDYATTELSYTPSNYGGEKGIGSTLFALVDNVADKVILPIGTVILTYIVLYEFITMVIDKNNFHEFDTSIFFRWIVKTGIAIYFLSNSSTIINAFFDLGSMMSTNLNTQVNAAVADKGITSWSDAVLGFYDKISVFGIANLLGMLIPSFLIMVICLVIYVCIYVIVISRMCEIYLHIAVAPIPMATITNREFGDSGKNYLKIIFAFILQAFFILLCLGLFKFLILSLAGTVGSGEEVSFSNIVPQMFQIAAFGICMILLMFKSNGLAKSIVGAH